MSKALSLMAIFFMFARVFADGVVGDTPGSALIWAITATVLLFIINGLLHLGETAVSNLRTSRVKDLDNEKLRRLSAEGQQFFAATQVSIQLCRVGLFTIAAVVFPIAIAQRSGLAEPSFGWLLGVALLSSLVVGLINLTFFELLFRVIGRRDPEGWASRLFGFLTVCRVLAAPFVWIVGLFSIVFTKRFGVGPLFSPPVVTEEDLREMVEATGASGELIEDEKEMIHSIIEFTDTVAREVMTPRTDIDAVEITATARDVAVLIEETGHTRIPIYHGTIDRVVGIVHAKDLLKTLMNGNGSDLTRLMRPALFIPESKDLHQLLAEFRTGRTQMAIVQDEFGGTAGLVTIEDVVEEIVGEIVDEYDVEEPEVMEIGPHQWSIDGKMNLDDVNDEIDSEFESEEFDTIGGYVFGLFGKQPSDGDRIEEGHWELEVAETDGRRILRVKVRKKQAAEETVS